MRLLLLSLSCALLAVACAEGTSARDDGAAPDVLVDPALGLGFELRDPAFATVVDTGGGIAVLARGFSWSEGPVWVPALGGVLFTDVPNNVAYYWGPELPEASAKTDGVSGVDTFLFPSGYLANPYVGGEPGANGLHLDARGRLLLAQHGERRVARLETPLEEVRTAGYRAVDTAAFATLSARYEGKRYNSPNDLAVLPTGEILFSDPTYGVDKTFGEEARELDVTGVYRVDPAAPDAEPTLLYAAFERPNGVALTPEADSFYLASSKSGEPQWVVCPLRDEGAAPPAECRDFADATALAGPARPGNADGLFVLDTGHVLATGPGGVLVYDRGGRLLGIVRTGRATANVTVGGVDGRDVFITAADLLLRARLAPRA